MEEVPFLFLPKMMVLQYSGQKMKEDVGNRLSPPFHRAVRENRTKHTYAGKREKKYGKKVTRHVRRSLSSLAYAQRSWLRRTRPKEKRGGSESHQLICRRDIEKVFLLHRDLSSINEEKEPKKGKRVFSATSESLKKREVSKKERSLLLSPLSF